MLGAEQSSGASSSQRVRSGRLLRNLLRCANRWVAMTDDSIPERILIAHDDYHAKYVGRTADGRQFFLTTPFCPGGPDFIALFLFDDGGELLEAKIDILGPRADARLPGNAKPHGADEQQQLEQKLAELGEVSFESIEVKPFAIERDGVTFGLIPQEPEEPDEDWCVIVEPGNYMAFYPPWEGDYDT